MWDDVVYCFYFVGVLCGVFFGEEEYFVGEFLFGLVCYVC